MNWPEFWSGAAANTIGSIVGVIIGVPIALWMERVRQRQSDTVAETRRGNRQREIVEQLVRSLNANIGAVENLRAQLEKQATSLAPQLDASAWAIFRGELEGLPPELVYDLSLVFHRVEELPFVLRRFEDLYLTPGAMLPAVDKVRDALRHTLLELCVRFLAVAPSVRDRLKPFGPQ
jgi:hypothetical protein